MAFGFNGKPQPVGRHFSNLRKDEWDDKSHGFSKELRNIGIDPAASQETLWEIYNYAKANLSGETKEEVNPQFEKVLEVLNKYYDSWN